MTACTLCPRRCGTDRSRETGVCGEHDTVRAALAGLHFWEEPCITGTGGAGAVFFSGCNLRCIYCQNAEISRGHKGKPISQDRLRGIFAELIDQGADCIDLVTPTHFLPQIAAALEAERLPVPVVWNSGGYESAAALRRLEGLIDVYLPDYKYADAALAGRLSAAPDYPAAALAAIREMHRQTGPPGFDEDGLLRRGVLVRHLVLPGFTDNTLDCIDALTAAFAPGEILISLMSQYTPPAAPLPVESLNRRLREDEYRRCVDYLYLCGVEDGYVQELGSADAGFVPDFDCSGL